jgi:hypothetical protein
VRNWSIGSSISRASTLKAETRCNANHADPLHPLGLLRARRERPYSGRSAEKHDEVAKWRLLTR